MSISIWVNGEKRDLDGPITLRELIASLSPRAPFSVAVNTAFVPRTAYDRTVLGQDDRVDIVSPVFGG